MNTKLLIALVVLVAAGVAVYWFYPAHNTVAVAASARDATYTIDGQSVTLVGGKSVMPAAPGSASQITTQYFGNEATGDLSGDGVPDIAFILTQNSGGSGTFYYAAAAIKSGDGYLGTDAVLLGDRIAPQTTGITNGVLVVNYADRAAGESFAVQPSIGKSLYLKLDPATMQFGELVQNFEGETNAARLLPIAYPLYTGATWGSAQATTSADYGAVVQVQSTPTTGVTNIAKLSTPFTQYYHDKLIAAGWAPDMSREAGGPGAEISVYTKGNLFFVVKFHSVFTVQHPDAPSECPCNVQFTLMSN